MDTSPQDRQEGYIPEWNAQRGMQVDLSVCGFLLSSALLCPRGSDTVVGALNNAVELIQCTTYWCERIECSTGGPRGWAVLDLRLGLAKLTRVQYLQRTWVGIQSDQ